MPDANQDNDAYETLQAYGIKAVILAGLLAGPLVAGYGIYHAVTALEAGEAALAGDYTTMISAGATFLLVGLTGWYVAETRTLRREEQQRKDREEETVRESLATEIGAVEFDELLEDPDPDEIAMRRRVVPTVVYENNSGKLGLLDPSERDAVVEYYGHAQEVEEMAFAVRTDDKGRDELVSHLEALEEQQAAAMNELGEKGSGGLV